MKRIYALMLAAACAICLAGCVKDSLSADEAIPQGEEMIICGTMGDLVEDGAQAAADTPDTRTQVRNTKEVWWNYTDRIAVFMSSNTTANEFTSTLTSGMSKTSYFSGTIKKTGSKYYVGYPYSGAEYSTSSDALSLRVSSAQTALSGSFYPNTLPSYGSFTSSSKNFTMKPAAGGLKFHVSRDDIKKVTFKGNNSEKVAGTVTVAKLSKTPDISRSSSGGSTSITLKRSGSTDNLVANKDYFIVITPGSLSKGFTITLTTEGGESLIVTSTKSRTIKAGVFGTLTKALDEYAVPIAQAVDMGLPSGTKWASFNVGASKPEEYGDYFAWGETQPKENYNWSTYKWSNGDKYTKYCTNSSYWDSSDPMDNKTILDPEDDAASANWGVSWRMPTDAEWTELKENCTWTWTDNYNGTGIAGRVVTSNITGYETKSIFLPAAGYRDYTNLSYVGSRGYFWSSSLYTNYPFRAGGVYFYSDGVSSYYGLRCNGSSVRPVYGKLVPVTSVSLPEKTINVGVGTSASCQVTFTPTNATDKTLTIQIANTSVASATYDSGTGAITINGLATGTTNMTVYASSGVSATCEIKVSIEPQFVDLGLPSGTKWASFNVGASKPEEYGDYFAWGEIQPKSDYSWSTYKWCNGDYNKLTKYCTDSSYWDGYYLIDNKTVLDSEDDAASANWEGFWRIPTDADWTELRENCTWTRTDNYNATSIKGYIVTGSNGNSIFLPFGGNRDNTDFYNVTSGGYYWSSSLNMDYPSRAWGVNFGSDGVSRFRLNRYYGFSVRPVFGKQYPVTTVSLSEQTINVGVGKSASCQVTIKPSNATEKSLNVKMADTNVASATYDSTTGTITIYGLAPGTTTVRAYASSGANASCEIKVFKEAQAVDMGLPSGTKWANWNVGATNPEEYGDYFAWGETKPKYNYEWSTYKWCKGDESLLTKYCTKDDNWGGEGSKDNKTALDPEDDAASAIWGGSWRMPTDEDWKELYDNCTLTWETDNSGIAGHSGLVVTASNGNSIFLPAGGCRDQTYIQDDGYYGYYWSSTLYSDSPAFAWYFRFSDNYSILYTLDYFQRSRGRTVRAVQP